MKSISKEDYLSTIYKNRDDNDEVKATVIAEKLQVSNAAVSDMLKKLSNEKLVAYERYKAVRLTPDGERVARNMVRRHRIWEIFLHQIVGMPWEKVHDEAEKLEHSSSDELINRLEEMLNFPEFDPHGDPIPAKDGIMPKERKLLALNKLNIGERGIVRRVNDFDNGFLKYITGLGIKLKTEIVVVEKRNFDGSLMIKVGSSPWNISAVIASNIYVEIKKKKD